MQEAQLCHRSSAQQRVTTTMHHVTWLHARQKKLESRVHTNPYRAEEMLHVAVGCVRDYLTRLPELSLYISRDIPADSDRPYLHSL